MATHPLIQSLFGRFQNLNLMILREDLRRGSVATSTWFGSRALCPLAHGLMNADMAQQLLWPSRASKSERAYRIAARQLGVPLSDVDRFVRLWDSNEFGPDWLADQLDILWWERRADADLMQTILESGASPAGEQSLSHADGDRGDGYFDSAPFPGSQSTSACPCPL